MKHREEIIGNCRLILGDCLEVMPTLGRVDAVVTDPPYGVCLGDVDNGQSRDKNQQAYLGFEDTPEYLSKVCIPAIKIALEKSDRAAIFCGNRNLWLYPAATEVGCWYVPAAISRGKWGFNTSNIILYYGQSPRAGIGDFANSFILQASTEKNGHPCPKPLAVMDWLVNKATIGEQTVLDPFMGSGTTGVACAKLGRKFIGIEIEPKYFDIACKRIEQAYKQGDMFIAPPSKPVQGDMKL